MDIEKIESILAQAIEREASDVHLIAHQPPIFRIHGDLSATDNPPFTPEQLQNLLFTMIGDEQRKQFLEAKELDFSYAYKDEYQLRINIHYSDGNVAAAIRITPGKIKSYQELNLHPIVEKLANTKKGIIILSGTAGSGKSTTMNCIIDMINQTRKCKIVTIEDPIEYHHKSNKSFFIQREVGHDTQSFTNALKYALRQDPDVVSIGEIRDLESMRIALTTAETGHLVITTVHASDAVGTLNRIVTVFPMGHRDEILAQLSSNIVAVIYQILLPRKDGKGRVLATEVMLGTMAVRNLIRRNDFKEIRGLLDADETEGMYSLEVCLSKLYKDGLISYETAKEYANHQHSAKLKEALQAKDRKLKVLILHNDMAAINAMGKVLMGAFDCEILYADNGKEGLPQIAKVKPDLVIVNTQLKDMNGFDAARKVREAGASDTIKLVMVTASFQPTDAEDAATIGVDGFAIQTQDFGLLMDAVNKAFG